MVRLEDFNLTLEVINNIIILDRDNKIVFGGDEIQELLLEKTPHRKDFLANFPLAEQALWKDKIEQTRRSKHSTSFELERIKQKIFLFPGNYKKDHAIILSTEDKIQKPNQVQYELKERVKELRSLYNISNDIEMARTLDEAIENSLPHLVNGFQFPEATSVCFRLDKLVYGKQIKKTPSASIIHEDIIVNLIPRGSIQIFCSHPSGFLEEEKNLLKEVTYIFSKTIERVENRQDVDKQKKILMRKNTKLIELTNECRRSRENLEALLQAMGGEIIVVDKNYDILLSNRHAIKPGQKCHKALFSLEKQCETCPLNQVFNEKCSLKQERKIKEKFFKLQFFPILNEKGQVLNMLEICTNVTKEKQMEFQLLQSYKLSSLGKLVAGIAHEINNPNTFIRGNINIIKESFEDIFPILEQAYRSNPELQVARLNYDVFRENIPILMEDMISGANRIKKIVDGLRNYARKDEGLLTDDVKINNIVNNSLRLVENQIRRMAKVKKYLSDKIPVIKGNSQKLEQVLVNLVINASQAVEEGQGIIKIYTDFDEEKNEINIRVVDNGRGIDDKIKKYIFDPFYTTKRAKGGTGLGLSISYGIIKEHHGKITVSSKKDQGTTFYISLPTNTKGKE